MKLKGISIVAVSVTLCTYPAFSKTTFPPDSLSADSTASSIDDNYISVQLDSIADQINFVDLSDREIPPIFEFVPATVEGRLAYLQNAVPLTYNEQVQSYIDVYSTDRYKRYLSNMLGLGAYYFPIYERVFAEMGVPSEIKYLSIVESALNPHAVSRVGATGLWQFMFTTARMYNLTMDSYIDERKDPVAASYAAAAYLRDAYDEFGDWLLAIASYNCGKGNVLRAIERTGVSSPDYWTVSRYLPRETRKYVPAFIAMTYMLGYHKEHNIVPNLPEDAVDTTEVVWVQRFVPFGSVAKALDVDEKVIKMLNPAYKRSVVNGGLESPRKLVLPRVQPEAYSALYAVLNHPDKQQLPKVLNASNSTVNRREKRVITHRVRKGQTLGAIARQYQVTVQDLRAWNHIKQNIIVPGQRLQIHPPGSYITYRVKRGDTLSEIAKQYRTANVSEIKETNGLKSNHIRPGMTLKIKID